MYRVPQAGPWWPAVGAPLEQGVRPRMNTPLLLGARSSFRSARSRARFGCTAKTTGASASAALTSVGVRGTRLHTSTAHDLAHFVVEPPHVAVAGNGSILVLPSSRAIRRAIPMRCASEALAVSQGAAQSAPPSCRSGAAAAEYGYRYCLLLAWVAQTADPLSPQPRERGAGGTEAGPSTIRASVCRPQRRLTPRSSRAPTAGHAGPAGGTLYIFASRASTSHRRCRLNSNVRPHNQFHWSAAT